MSDLYSFEWKRVRHTLVIVIRWSTGLVFFTRKILKAAAKTWTHTRSQMCLAQEGIGNSSLSTFKQIYSRFLGIFNLQIYAIKLQERHTICNIFHRTCLTMKNPFLIGLPFFITFYLKCGPWLRPFYKIRSLDQNMNCPYH